MARSIIPIGFMPEHDGNRLYPLVICSSMGTSTVYVPADKIPAPAQKNHSSNNAYTPCSFSAAFAYGALPQIAVFIPALQNAEYASSFKEAAYINAAAKAYFSQGPPQILLQS